MGGGEEKRDEGRIKQIFFDSRNERKRERKRARQRQHNFGRLVGGCKLGVAYKEEETSTNPSALPRGRPRETSNPLYDSRDTGTAAGRNLRDVGGNFPAPLSFARPVPSHLPPLSLLFLAFALPRPRTTSPSFVVRPPSAL